MINQVWLDALKSGDYKQTIGRKKRGNAFCAIGVGFDCYRKAHDLTWHSQWSELLRFDGTSFSEEPGELILEWLGINLANYDDITYANDSRKLKLPEIADLIESWPIK